MSEEVDSHIVENYDIQKRLGKGAYGIVWKAVDRRTNEAIALKKIFDAFRNATDAQRTFREIMFLQEFGRHPNVIKLYNILKADNDKDIYLVFEYMEADLHNVIKKMTILKDIHKQYIMCQLFRAIKFLHSGNVLHRDLKPSNVLLDAECRVKLADFGLARSFSQMDDSLDGSNVPELTEYVATRWYRSPEILLAAKHYTKGVDMWSLGCILAEMLLGKALFPGSSTINQIERIMNTIQRPSKNDIESIGSAYASSVLEKMPQWPKKPLDIVLSQTTPEALDLVSRLLIFAPHKRLNVEQCLEHPYVSQFHNKAEEPSLDYEVRLPLPVSRLLIFAPHKRLNVEQCLEHPYVSQFHNKAEEPSLDYEVRLPLPDHIQLSVHEYRDKLYEIISTKKVNIQRINYPNINDKNTTCNGWVEKQQQHHQNGEIIKEQQKRRQSTTMKEQHLKEQQQNVLEKNSVVNSKLEKEKTSTNATTNEKHKNNKRVIQQQQTQQQHSITTTSPLPSIKTTKTLNKQQTQQQQETSPTDSEKTPKQVVKHLKNNNNNVGIEKKNNNGNINGGLKQQQQYKFNNKHEIGSSPSVERNTSGGHYGRKIGLVSNGITTSATMSRSMSESKGLNHHQNGGGLIHSKLHQQNNNQAPIALAEPSDTDLDTCSSTSSGLTMGNGGKTAKIMGSNGTLLNEQQHQQHQNTRRSFGNLFSNIIQKQQHSHNQNNVDDGSVIRARAQSIESSTAATTNYPSKFSLRTRSREKVKSSKEDQQQQQQNLYIDGKQQQKSATNSRRSHDRLRIFSALRPSKTSVNN
uniref:Mitogen-activated protein kinase n=1 Tax=Meloidogyne incognita TaxID=6306 RepID=A0A914LL67_MELIC